VIVDDPSEPAKVEIDHDLWNQAKIKKKHLVADVPSFREACSGQPRFRHTVPKAVL
jgi:hypothetical protein